MWFSDVQHQFNRMMVPGRVKVKPAIEKEFMSYLKMLLSIMGQVKHEVHLGEFQAFTQWLPGFFDKKTGSPSQAPFMEQLDLLPFPGETINWVEYYDGISVCIMYMVNGGIITMFPIFQMPHDDEWWPATVFATVCNGKTFRSEIGDSPESRDKRKTNAIPDDMLDQQVNIRVIGDQADIDKKVFDFHTRIVTQSIVVMEEYGLLLGQEWVTMGDEVLSRAERRLVERDESGQIERKVLAVVEDGVARMIGSFKCDKCRDTGMIHSPETVNQFCDCAIGEDLVQGVATSVESQEDGEQSQSEDAAEPKVEEVAASEEDDDS